MSEEETNRPGGIECDWRAHWTHIYSGNLLDKNGIRFPESVSGVEDMAFIEMTQWCATKRIRINKMMYNYWLNKDSVVHTGSKIKIFEQDYNFAKVIKEFYIPYGINTVHYPVKRLGPALTELCSLYSYKECNEFIDRHPLCREQMANIHNYGFRKAVVKPIVLWNKYGKFYWLYARITYRINRFSRKMIYRYRPLLAIVSLIKYKYIQGYQAIDIKKHLP